MEDDKRRAFICSQATARAKKQQEEGVLPKGKGSIELVPKKKNKDKVNRPLKKPKVVTGSTVGETPPTTQLPFPSHPGKRKGLITGHGSVSEKRPILLHEDSQYAIGYLSSIIMANDYRTWATMQPRP